MRLQVPGTMLPHESATVLCRFSSVLSASASHRLQAESTLGFLLHPLVTLFPKFPKSRGDLFIDSPSVVWGMPSNVVFETLSSVRLPDYNQLQGCTSTAALTINVCSLFAIPPILY